jgi:hypothetical protein
MEAQMLHRSVRATPLERTRRLAGDELIQDPIASMTHAITIRRPRRDVWPWIAQMGAGSRAGWYSYDFLDNGRRRSADRILPDLQHVAIGTLFPASPGATDGFHVLQIETGRSLVLGWVPAKGSAPIMTWAFVLEEADEGCTRLVARARGSHDYPFYGLPRAIGEPIIRCVHFIMERKQLVGIASRAEVGRGGSLLYRAK